MMLLKRKSGFGFHVLRTWFLLFLLVPQFSWAVATPAGSIISNVATVSYSLAGLVQTPVVSAPVLLKVDELIQPVLAWQDGLPVSVNTPGLNNVLTFMLTNAGNGPEAFGLTRSNGPAPLPAGNYVPINSVLYDPANSPTGAMFLETNGVAGFQPGLDAAYVAGVNDPNLLAGASQIIYVVSDTPALVAPNSKGDVLLTAASRTAGAAGAAPGTSFAGLGQGGSAAVVGKTRALANITGSYIASGLGLVINKTILSVLDPNGTAVVMTGSVLTYQIVATLSGIGTASNLVINDPLPANMTYVPGSITLGGVVQTDAVDADQGQFNAITQTVSVLLGNVASPASAVITFRATIN